MKQVIHGLTREQLIKLLFGKTKPSQWDSRSEKGGKNKKGGGGF